MFDVALIELFAYLILLIAIIFFFRQNDELPFILVLFFLMTGLFRYQAVEKGVVDWVVVNYTLDIFDLNDEKAVTALNLFLLGTTLFVLSYLFFKSTIPKPEVKDKDSDEHFHAFLEQKSKFILVLFIFFIVLNSFMSGFVSGAASFGNSYFLQFQFAIGGLILLMFLVFQRVSFSESAGTKILFLILLAYSMYISYNPASRFTLLSWMIALVVMLTYNKTAGSKSKYFFVGGFTVMIVFALAGADRQTNLNEMSPGELYEMAVERTTQTEDMNMLDGFMMVLDVYPEHLDFHYGMEHVEILLRPIPRKLWPGKPVGGYANKLGLTDYENVGTVGISQTIYGSFYGEGGVMGVILLSIVYGWLFAKLLNLSYKYSSDVQGLIKGLIIASLIPLLRGGDLPGIIAWVGMSYWPVFLFLYQYNKYLQNLPEEEEEEAAQDTMVPVS